MPEMIEAGLEALFAFDSRFATYADCIEDVFRAMWLAMGAQKHDAGSAKVPTEAD
jgi:hypothetical protein